ncbi:hypothetical protein SDC9_53502 [bioreactor metagenome]|uniref:Bacterial surface antigen (D15) domain-containing protein n=1 Tax=bioreactor metagenome TaxID=1076179 RepID=A0A644WTE2_9ZZZZ
MVFCDSGIVRVNVTERWYIWPVPFFNIEERNFNVWLRNMSLEKVTYGLYVYNENFRGRKEYLKLLCKTGYNQIYGMSYSKPYIDRKQNWGFSAALGFEASHSISYNVINHEPENLKLADGYAYSGLFSQMSATRRVGMYQLHKFSVMYEATSFSDSLLLINPHYAPSVKWNRFSLNYQYRYDLRDFKNYPLHGWYADAEVNLGGFITLSEEKDSRYYIKSTSRKYIALHGPFYFATGATFLFSFKEGQIFADGCFMGYGNDFVRGFQYRVIPVRNYFIHRNNLKYNLLKQRIVVLPLIRTSKFNKVPVSVFTNLFFDQGWSGQGRFSPGNSLAGEYLAGYGLGIDFVTYYDKVLRIEFTMNRFREKGIFLHFTAPV